MNSEEKMPWQGFSADADSIPWSRVVISGNKEKMNHNNLGNKNAIINNIQKSFLRDRNFSVLNHLVYYESHLRLKRYRINKKVTYSKSLIKIQQQK